MIPVHQCPPNQVRTGQCRSAARAHQAFLLPTSTNGGGEDDVYGLVVDAQSAGAVGSGLTEAVVQQDAEVAVARLDLAHEDVGAVVQEGVGGAVKGLVVGAPPTTADACRGGRALPSAPRSYHLGVALSHLSPSFRTQVDPVGWGGPLDVSTQSLWSMTSFGGKEGLCSCD